MTITNNDPLVLVCDILQHELDIPKERLFIFNDDRELPKDDNLYIVVEPESFPPYGVSHTHKIENGKYYEVTSASYKYRILIHCCSVNPEACDIAPQVSICMNSDFARNYMLSKGFHIGKLPVDVRNMSSVEGTRRMNRLDCEFNMLSTVTTQKEVEYYDKFQNPEAITEA